jgi:hypothetical protein
MFDKKFTELLGKKILIMGDVGAGKTRLTLRLLNEAINLGRAREITLIDMAPSTVIREVRKVGGKIGEFTDAVKKIRCLTPQVVETPRLSAHSSDELLKLVKINKERMDPLLKEYLENPTKIAFINDMSMYFQSGAFDLILSVARKADTFVANGYYGKFFAFDFGTGVSKIERDLMDKLAQHMDTVLRIERSGSK